MLWWVVVAILSYPIPPIAREISLVVRGQDGARELLQEVSRFFCRQSCAILDLGSTISRYRHLVSTATSVFGDGGTPALAPVVLGFFSACPKVCCGL